MAVTWLLGHRRPHLSLYDGSTRLMDIHRTIIGSGQPLLWINPSEMKIAVGYRRESVAPEAGAPEVNYWRRSIAEDERADVQPLPMANWSVTPTGLTNPELARLDEGAKNLLAAKARRRDAEAGADAQRRRVEASLLRKKRARQARARARWRSDWGEELGAAGPRHHPVPPGKAVRRGWAVAMLRVWEFDLRGGGRGAGWVRRLVHRGAGGRVGRCRGTRRPSG